MQDTVHHGQALPGSHRSRRVRHIGGAERRRRWREGEERFSRGGEPATRVACRGHREVPSTRYQWHLRVPGLLSKNAKPVGHETADDNEPTHDQAYGFFYVSTHPVPHASTAI